MNVDAVEPLEYMSAVDNGSLYQTVVLMNIRVAYQTTIFIDWTLNPLCVCKLYLLVVSNASSKVSDENVREGSSYWLMETRDIWNHWLLPLSSMLKGAENAGSQFYLTPSSTSGRLPEPSSCSGCTARHTPCRYAGITAQIYKEDPAYVFDAYGNSIFGSYFK